MTSNAKIGLLLGLVVIFIIIFVINGLSDIKDATDRDDLSEIVTIEPIGIKPDILPEDFPSGRVPERHPEETLTQMDKERFQTQPLETISPDETDNSNEPVRQVWPKVHVVLEGDSLAEIAKKFYGRKEGNRRANIKRIFEANSELLESPNKIYPGQKLVIPSLWALDSDRNSIEGIFPGSMFEKVESIGRRHL
jgi:nucleoid-associated protein YgaU